MNRKQFLLLMAYSMIVILLIFLPRYTTLSQGKEIILKTEPVDPRDIFRGDYVVLNYEISSVDLEEMNHDYDFINGEQIYAVLSEKDGYWTIDSVNHSKPAFGSESACMKGTVTGNSDDILMVEWGIESYFVPEGEGRVIQEQMGDISVVVSVHDDCSAVVRELLLEGKPIEFE